MECLKVRNINTQRESVIWKCEQGQKEQRDRLGCKGQEAAETVSRHRAKDEVKVSLGYLWCHY